MNKIVAALLAGGLGAMALLGPGSVQGAPGERVPPPPIGQETRAWLALQSGGQAAGVAQPMPGAVAARVYQRYLESYSHPIPEFFEREKSYTGKGR